VYILQVPIFILNHKKAIPLKMISESCRPDALNLYKHVKGEPPPVVLVT